MTAKFQPPGQAGVKGWVPLESGYDVTQSPEIISQALARLKTERVLVTLLHKGYQSGSTILIDFNAQQLLIDKPLDWPGTQTTIRVVYRDPAKLWNHFGVKVQSVTADTLYTSYPRKLYRLQRRAHFRVEAPRESKASFSHMGRRCEQLDIIDLSAGGMQICTRQKLDLSEGSVIADIVLFLPASVSASGSQIGKDTMLHVRQGDVVRVSRGEKGALCYGIDFRHSQNEEELLLKYVRLRELELLRSGIAY